MGLRWLRDTKGAARNLFAKIHSCFGGVASVAAPPAGDSYVRGVLPSNGSLHNAFLRGGILLHSNQGAANPFLKTTPAQRPCAAQMIGLYSSQPQTRQKNSRKCGAKEQLPLSADGRISDDSKITRRISTQTYVIYITLWDTLGYFGSVLVLSSKGFHFSDGAPRMFFVQGGRVTAREPTVWKRTA